jgi:hypothetical protein
MPRCEFCGQEFAEGDVCIFCDPPKVRTGVQLTRTEEGEPRWYTWMDVSGFTLRSDKLVSESDAKALESLILEAAKRGEWKRSR